MATKRDVFEFVVANVEDEEIVEAATKALEAMDKTNEKAKERNAAKRAEKGESNVAEVNAKINADVEKVLGSEPMTRGQIFDALGGEDYTYTKADGSDASLTVQKLSTAMKVGVDAGTIEKSKVLVDGKLATAYALA